MRRSLTFEGGKLVVPWTLLFDSRGRKPLLRLRVLFDADEFDVLRVTALPEFGSPMQRPDPTHPALLAFELQYEWRAAAQEDLAAGVGAMFALALLGVLLLGWHAVASERRGEVAAAARRRKGKSG